MPRGSKPGERRGGRKKGTPNKVTADVKILARQHGVEAIEKLAQLMRGRDRQLDRLAAKIEALPLDSGQEERARLYRELLACLTAQNPQIELSAAKELLDRGYGRPAQTVAMPDTGQAIVAIERVIIEPQDRLVHSGPLIDQPPVNGKDHATLSPSLSPEAAPRLPPAD
jgi:hypothetical protein